MRKAELLQHAPEAHFRQIDAEAFPENTLEVAATPAHDPVLLRVGSGLDELLQRLLLLRRELRRPPRRFAVDQAGSTMLVEAVHPVPQCLPVHAADRAASARIIPS